MQWPTALMFVTLTGIFTSSFRARAEEPPRAADAGAPLPTPPPVTDRDSPRVAPPLSEPTTPTRTETDTVAPSEGAPQGPPPALSPPERSEVRAVPDASSDVPAFQGTPGEPLTVDLGQPKKKKNKRGKAAKTAKDAPPGEEHAQFGAVEIRGRVIARSELERRETRVLDDMLNPVNRTVESLDFSVPSARLAFHYRAPVDWLSAVAEVDIAGQPDMKDAFVQARSDGFTLRAGQFRVPVSTIEMTSPWTLPTARRGLLRDVLVDRMDFGGRRPGIMLGFRGKELPLRPRVWVGAFQGAFLAKDPTPTGRDTDLLNAMKFPSQTVAARAEVEIAGLEVGAWYENRIGSPTLFQTYRYWTSGADLHYEHVFAHGGLRFWLEGITGSSWYEVASKTPDGKDAMFVVARAQIAYRFGGTTDEAFYVEPYVLAAGLDPDAQVTSDVLLEGVVGVNVGYWKRARLTLQGEMDKGSRNFPESIFVSPPPNRQSIILQAGVAF